MRGIRTASKGILGQSIMDIGTECEGYRDRVLWILGQSLRDIGTQFKG